MEIYLWRNAQNISVVPMMNKESPRLPLVVQCVCRRVFIGRHRHSANWIPSEICHDSTALAKTHTFANTLPAVATPTPDLFHFAHIAFCRCEILLKELTLDVTHFAFSTKSKAECVTK